MSEARKKVKEAEDKAETSRLDVIQILKQSDELREASCLAAEVSEKARAEATSSKDEMERRLQEEREKHRVERSRIPDSTGLQAKLEDAINRAVNAEEWVKRDAERHSNQSKADNEYIEQAKNLIIARNAEIETWK